MLCLQKCPFTFSEEVINNTMKRNDKRKKGLKIASIIILIIMIVIILLFVMFLIPFLMMLFGDADRLI